MCSNKDGNDEACFRCGSTGHFHNECLMKKKSVSLVGSTEENFEPPSDATKHGNIEHIAGFAMKT